MRHIGLMQVAAMAATLGLTVHAPTAAPRGGDAAGAEAPEVLVIGLGDSLTHGTLDATNNRTNSLNAYLQRVADGLAAVVPVAFTQPLFDYQGERLRPFQIPTNAGVDGADIFSAEGIEYYKRVGAEASYVTDAYLCDVLAPERLEDPYDKVLYPHNLFAGEPVSQVDTAVGLLRANRNRRDPREVLLAFWLGNNESSTSALGLGGANPTVLPLPFEQVKQELAPGLRLLLKAGKESGALSFAPYTQAMIERNLTATEDFAQQLERVLARLDEAASEQPLPARILVMTLPYYSAVGYLFDSEDLEYYLGKLEPGYAVPASFARVAPPGAAISDPLAGNRVSLLTFGLMYALLASGTDISEVNAVLDADGTQVDGMVLSEAESAFIRGRIDAYNRIILEAVAEVGTPFVPVDVGQALNEGLAGTTPVVVGGEALSRKWARGGALSLDGVHPGYTGHALIANLVLETVNALTGRDAPLADLDAVRTGDPYVDNDGDGWVPGPDYPADGITELLFLFRDPDDGHADIGVTLPPDVWDIISEALLQEILEIPQVQEIAAREGVES